MRARAAAIALSLVASLAVADARAEAPEGTVADRRTGLVWVADPQFAVTSGFAPSVVMPRAKAQRLVAAMNAGRLPGFGRSDWRLPTRRELARWLRRNHLAIPPGGNGARRLWAWPVAGAATLPGVADAAILATNSVHLHRNGLVLGDVVVNDAAPGPTLGGVELALDRDVRIDGDIAADDVRLDRRAVVSGDGRFNELTGDGVVEGTLSSPLPLPVFAVLPVFQTTVPRPGAPDVAVDPGETVELPPGDYGDLSVAAGGRLVLAGGAYDVRGIILQGGGKCPPPCSALEAAGAATVRVAQRLGGGTGVFVGPAEGAGVDASDLVFFVGGFDGAEGSPPAVGFGRDAQVEANLYAPNGSIRFDRDAVVRGALIARDVRLDQGAVVEVASWFANRPPLAIPVDAFTGGTDPITIVLRGSDPDGDDLTFSIATQPSHGTLGPVVELPPPAEPGDPDRPQGDPPRTEATVTYTPDGAGDLEDAFAFRVTDTAGGSGTATVRINPPDGGEPPQEPETILALASLAETVAGTPVTVDLRGDAPAGVELDFAIEPGSGPLQGTLGAVVPGEESPRRSASIVYTPGPDASGVDTFRFTACGIISGATVCDTATASIAIAAENQPPELAPDLSVATPQATAVPIALGLGLSGGGAGSLVVPGEVRLVTGKAIALDPAEVGGNVADADGDGLGDNHNGSLAAGVPVFVNAGVGLNGGPGSNGTVRIHIEWDITALGPLGADENADVLLTTNRGTVDALDTLFFAGSGGDGALTDDDFEAPDLERVTGAVMPVIGVVGADGTFLFDVREPLQNAIAAGATHFTVQGRVDETATSGRGLSVYSTAANPLNEGKEPALVLTTPPPLPPILFVIESLPLHGILLDGSGKQITAVPAELAGELVTYVPDVGLVGEDGFDYSARLGEVIDLGRVRILVLPLDCATDAAGCDDGR